MSGQLALPFGQVPSPRLDISSLCDGDERAMAAALCWGRERARQVGEIAREAGVPGRRVQELVAHLLLEHQWPIGTAMSEPFGNYLIDNSRELEETVALLRTRGISSLARAAALRKTSLNRYLDEVQTQLKLDGQI